MRSRIAVMFLLGCFLSAQAAADYSWKDRCRPVGSWLITIDFEQLPFPFQELVTLHADRTLVETNSGLHSNSFPDPNAMPSGPVPPWNGSDGHGAWKLKRGCKVQFSFLKFVFNGVNAPNGPPAGIPIGFFKVSGLARIQGNSYVSVAGDTTAQFIPGTDPNSTKGVMDFGPSTSMGFKLMSSD
ncbi:MAG: hypothetical protein ACR2Q3_02800 [Woeseiaceae bacterium]